MSDINKGSFEELIVWQKARKLRLEIRILVDEQFPKEERYRLTDQIIRSSRSICDNISEGHGIFHYQKHIHYCRIARGSLSETKNHLITALDENFIDKESLKGLK